MRVLFIVQGEGRGHMTQALAVRAMLASAGHRVTSVLTGNVRNRELPEFFVQKIDAPVRSFASPGFSLGKEHRSVRRLPTILKNLGRVPHFAKSLAAIDDGVASGRPDLVLAFYEPMAGLYQALYRPDVPFVAIGHQYMFEHPAYAFASGHRLDRVGLRLFTRLTALGAAWRIGLSLYPAMDMPGDHLSVVPPLLRGAVLDRDVDDVTDDEFYLIYLLNRGYAEQVISWHEDHPDVRLICFWDHPDADRIVDYDDTLRFHRLDDVAFLDAMARCSGLICTAGFESVSEALYLGKPILAVPVEGHYEQQCNAREVEMLGAGLAGDTFDLSPFPAFIRRFAPPSDAFRAWVARAEERVLHVLEAAAARRLPSFPRARDAQREPVAPGG